MVDVGVLYPFISKTEKQYQNVKLKYSDILIEREKAGNRGYCSECITKKDLFR